MLGSRDARVTRRLLLKVHERLYGHGLDDELPDADCLVDDALAEWWLVLIRRCEHPGLQANQDVYGLSRNTVEVLPLCDALMKGSDGASMKLLIESLTCP